MARPDTSPTGNARGRRRWRRIAFAGVALGAAIVAIVYSVTGLADFDIDGRAGRDLAFDTAQGVVQGTLLLPDGSGPFAAAVVVHGDGPQDRFSDDGYLPLMNALLDAGIAVFSWDKPGIGASQGNWLDQSMQDRADEALAAWNAVAAEPDIRGAATGILGFSQAGWVLPRLAVRSDAPSFYVVVGGAIDWAAQGAYLTRARMTQQGYGTHDIDAALAFDRARNDRLFSGSADYADYVAALSDGGAPAGVSSTPMSPQRFAFVARNFDSDARNELAEIHAPFLALLGADDLNVDAAESAHVYSEFLADANPENRIIIVPDATHSLLRSGPYNHQLPSEWSQAARLRFLLAGRRAYAPGVIDTLTGWIHLVTAP